MKSLKDSLFNSCALTEREKSKVNGGGAYCDSPVSTTDLNSGSVAIDDSVYDG